MFHFDWMVPPGSVLCKENNETFHGQPPISLLGVFSDIAKAPSLQKAREDLEKYLSQCPTDRVAQPPGLFGVWVYVPVG